MNDLSTELAELRIEVKYLKWIIPSACGLIALLFLIFWGIERKNIGDKVRLALEKEGVKTAVDETKEWISEAKKSSKIIADKKDEAMELVNQAENNSNIIADRKDDELVKSQKRPI